MSNNFLQHFENIQKQVNDDHKTLVDENGEYEITKENRQLEEKYQELLKEVEDKGKLMEDQLKEKEDGISNIESQMQEKLEAQIKVYKEQTAKKQEEE